MLGAIAGDIIGSPYEHHPIKSEDFPLFLPVSRFTDDTVLTVAAADVLLNGGDYCAAFREYGRAYPRAGYGHAFNDWLYQRNPAPYYSFGNGSAMRVSPVGWAFDGEAEVLAEAERSAAVTHNHPEGIKGAQAVALAVFLARKGASRDEIRAAVGARTGYRLNLPLEAVRPTYTFDSSCQNSVPQALIALFDSSSFEDAVRKAVSLGGDADTQACVAGAVAEALYGGLPPEVERAARERLPAAFLRVVDAFYARFVTAKTG